MAENTEKFFKFIWKVDNFSYIWNEKDDFLRSPNFSLDVFGGSDWCLKLYPRGRSWYENCVSVYLERLSSSKGPLETKIFFKIALLSRNSETEFGWGKSEQLFRRGSEHGFDSMVSRERLLGTKNSNLLPDDILTLQCCILPQHNEFQVSTEVIAKTHTEIECFVRQWKEIDYTADNLMSFRKGYSRSVSLRLIVSKDSDNQAYVLSCQFHNAIDLKAFHGKISILDSNNSVVECLLNQFFDIESAKEGTQCYLFFTLITLAELLKHKSRFLPNGKLNLYCELTLSYGLQHSQIERIAHDASFMCAPVEETASTSQIDVPAKRFLYCIDNIPTLLKKDFQNLLQEGTLSDFTIKVGNKNFQVHKAVLCARSPTFKAMLTRNMKENEENLVVISDLEEDTVHRMLTFMYTEMAGNLDWETAYKLYFDGDKYCLPTLKRLCSDALKQNLSVSNVGEVLVLGNTHSDEYLKEIAIEFICDHETEVMRSMEWKTFMNEEVHLAAETMHHVSLKKADNRQ